MWRLASIALIMLMLTPGSAFADVVLIVRKEAEATGNYVRICDIARVEGPKEQVNEVSKTVLGPTPPRGESMEISRWDIETRLYELGIASRIIFSGNDTVKVLNGVAGYAFRADVPLRDLDPMETRPADSAAGINGGFNSSPPGSRSPATGRGERIGTAQREGFVEHLAPESLELINRAVSGYLAKQYERQDIEIESTPKQLSAALPPTIHEVTVDWGKGNVPGTAQLQLKVKEKPDSQAKTVLLDADVDVFALAPVAARPLSKGESVSVRDIALQRVRMEPGKGYFKPEPKAVAGRELKHSMKKGEPFLPSDTVIPPAVKQGDDVINRTSSNGWQLTAMGKALGGGMVGDIISVQDPKTKAKYDARITGPGMVEVVLKKKPYADFGAVPATTN